MAMAKKDSAEADYVAAIPDSGIGMGLGYAEGKGIPYRRAIIKYTPTWPRSFTPANQSVRDLVAKMKLIPNRDLLKDKKVPILHACPFLWFSNSRSPLELIARRIVKELEGDDTKNLEKYSSTDSEQYTNMVECIREKLNITTLKFLSVEDLITAIGLPKECVCTHCYNGTSHF
jgi:amidophosphoribosyltransferase